VHTGFVAGLIVSAVMTAFFGISAFRAHQALVRLVEKIRSEQRGRRASHLAHRHRVP
jgi:hypothetical protein